MKYRKHLAWLGIAAAIATAIVVAWLAWPRPGVTLENYKSLHLRMDRAQAEEILGGPPGDYSVGMPPQFGEHAYHASRWNGVTNYWLLGPEKEKGGCLTMIEHLSDKPEPDERRALRHAAELAGYLEPGGIITFAWERMYFTCLVDNVK